MERWNWPGILYLPHVMPVWQKFSPLTHGHHDCWWQMHLWDLQKPDFNWLVKIGKQLLTSTDLHCSRWFLLKSRNLQETLESSWDSDSLWRNKGATGVPRVWSALSESCEKGPCYWEKSPLQMQTLQWQGNGYLWWQTATDVLIEAVHKYSTSHQSKLHSFPSLLVLCS